MNKLLKKANIPDDQSMYVGKLIGEPFFSTGDYWESLPEGFARAAYALHARPLWRCPYALVERFGELVLDTAERIPVEIVSDDMIIPTLQAIKSGRHKPSDYYFHINAEGLTHEQVKRARYFVQAQRTTGSQAKAPVAQTTPQRDEALSNHHSP